MEPAEIITLGLEGLKLGTSIIEAVNAGDLATAQTLLATARDHYAKASAAWDAVAPGILAFG